MKPKYAIVRVNDDNCPDHFEDIENKFVCENKNLTIQQSLRGINIEKCILCRYGDTKEQLIMKVAQVIFIKRNSFGGKNMNTIWTETDKIYSYKLAKEIVEFLGVKE